MDKNMRQLLLDRSNILVCMNADNGPEVARRLQDELYDVDEKIRSINQKQIAKGADQREMREGTF